MEWGGGSNNKRHSPSVDRIIPDIGYTRGNVRWVLDQANTLKNDRNFDLIEKIYYDMKKLMNK